MTTFDMTRRLHARTSFRQQRGAATLVVVMILFFIMAMMAAYANRNLIFEQRIASNYYRSGIALEVADGGTEWALSMLNGGNVDQTCQPGADATTRFVQRYLVTNPETRALTPLTPQELDSAGSTASSCVRTADQRWVCQCPDPGAWAAPTDVPDSQRMQPSFGIYLQPSRAGVVRITSLGCTSPDTRLCTIANQATANSQLLAAAYVRVEAALVSALKSPPTMPLTVGLNVGGGAGALGLHNSDPSGNGILLAAGGTVAANALSEARLNSMPGTPSEQTLITLDPTLSAAQASGTMFSMFFGMPPAQYQTQPAIRVVNCSANCSVDLEAAINLGARMLWIDGPMTLSSNLTLGTADKPVIVVVAGAVTINSPMVINGVLYATNDVSWANNTGLPAVLNGAVVSERTFAATGTVDLVYRADIISILSNATGSFVRVPGSWWDAGGGY